MTSLTAIFGRSREDARDSDKLLELYWNRAELKKEFANLRNETFRLKDLVKEQKGHAARSQQQLLQLENLLLDPEWVDSVAVFYQFRALNAHLTRKLATFAEQLKQQREQRQHRQLLSTWRSKRDAEAAGIEARLAEVRERIRSADDRLQGIRQGYSARNALMRFLLKRSTKRALDSIAAALETDQSLEREYDAALAGIGSLQAPDVQGLDVTAKRSINCMILSLAQQLYLHFRDSDIAALVRDAGRSSAGAQRYGTKQECDAMLAIMRRLRGTMPRTTDFADVLQQRARLIGERARYRDENEAVPTMQSVGAVLDLSETGRVRELGANLLRDNYWGLSDVLSR